LNPTKLLIVYKTPLLPCLLSLRFPPLSFSVFVVSSPHLSFRMGTSVFFFLFLFFWVLVFLSPPLPYRIILSQCVRVLLSAPCLSSLGLIPPHWRISNPGWILATGAEFWLWRLQNIIAIFNYYSQICEIQICELFHIFNRILVDANSAVEKYLKKNRVCCFWLFTSGGNPFCPGVSDYWLSYNQVYWIQHVEIL
jgi:hypothetical protein